MFKSLQVSKSSSLHVVLMTEGWAAQVTGSCSTGASTVGKVWVLSLEICGSGKEAPRPLYINHQPMDQRMADILEQHLLWSFHSLTTNHKQAHLNPWFLILQYSNLTQGAMAMQLADLGLECGAAQKNFHPGWHSTIKLLMNATSQKTQQSNL